MPATFWCYDPLDEDPPAVGPLPALAKGHVTFGCLNNFCKVNQGVLQLWARVLGSVAGSRLMLLADEGARAACEEAFSERWSKAASGSVLNSVTKLTRGT